MKINFIIQNAKKTMNKKIILSLSMIVAVAAIVIGATGAFFNDTEQSNGNTFTAGEVDLKIDSTCHYDGMVCKDKVWVEEESGSSTYPELVGKACSCTWAIDDLTGQPFFNYADVKPGDKGENTLSFHISSNPVWACLKVSNVFDKDNTCTEPEEKTEGSCTTDGELDENMLVRAWVDDSEGGKCDNVYQAGEQLITNGFIKLSDVLGEGVLPIASKDANAQLQTPLPAGDYCIGVEWKVPGETTNIAQTDSVGADLEFFVEQSRNNDKFTCIAR